MIHTVEDTETALIENAVQLINDRYETAYQTWLQHGFANEFTPNQLHLLLKEQKNQFLTLMDPQKPNIPVGTVLLKKSFPHPYQTLIGKLVVSSEYKGWGARLLHFAEEIAFKDSLCSEVILEVLNQATHLIRFYEVHGYRLKTDSHGEYIQRKLLDHWQAQATSSQLIGQLSFVQMHKTRSAFSFSDTEKF